METTVLSEVEALRNEVKSLTKLIRKIRSYQEDPTGEKAKARAVNNGFNRSLEISPKLREFLCLVDDESVSRSEVTRRINKYITENDLKHPDNGRMIIRPLSGCLRSFSVIYLLIRLVTSLRETDSSSTRHKNSRSFGEISRERLKPLFTARAFAFSPVGSS